MNLHDPYQFGELRRQRTACGWNFEAKTIESWRAAMDGKTKALFWITIPLADPPSEESQSVKGESSPNRVGHISLDSDKQPPDYEMAKPDKSVMEISTLYILQEYRRMGLATAAVVQLEGWAKVEPYGSPNCKALTVNTISKRYTEDEGEQWRGLFLKRGLTAPDRGWSTEEWYESMGYVKWKEEYVWNERVLDGMEIKLMAAFMRKDFS
jgi:GNAT superfamily N-acetyltransferase